MTDRCVHPSCEHDAAPHSAHCVEHAYVPFQPYQKTVSLAAQMKHPRRRPLEDEPVDQELLEALTADGRVR